MARVIHFEILATDVKRAEKFYKSVFGWKSQRWVGSPYVLLTTGPDKEPGINGAIMQREKPFHKKTGVSAYLCTIEGPEIKLTKYAKRVIKAGGKQLTEPKEVPNVGLHAYFADTEGNMFGILEANSK